TLAAREQLAVTRVGESGQTLPPTRCQRIIGAIAPSPRRSFTARLLLTREDGRAASRTLRRYNQRVGHRVCRSPRNIRWDSYFKSSCGCSFAGERRSTTG